MAKAAARATFAAGIVPIKLPVESEIAAGQKIAVDVAKAKVSIDSKESIGSLLWAGGVVPERSAEGKDRIGILAQWQIWSSAIEQNRAACAQLEERGWRQIEAHTG